MTVRFLAGKQEYQPIPMTLVGGNAESFFKWFMSCLPHRYKRRWRAINRARRLWSRP